MKSEQPKIWINLLNKPSYEEIGKIVIQKLMSKESEKKDKFGITHSEIIVIGS